MPRSAASAASFFTHSDRTEWADHSATTLRAPTSSRSMASSKLCPGTSWRSHQTDQPRAASAWASALARSRSSLA
ncbi:MAG TPA: hypothetical protein VLG41_04455 [Hydrogenophaga sp.]|nr:hypothetical protein [Hydrogenophaga sp.]HSX92150.1 hypothetical protein [Hydrogenophaga sp.]